MNGGDGSTRLPRAHIRGGLYVNKSLYARTLIRCCAFTVPDGPSCGSDDAVLDHESECEMGAVLH